MTQPKHTFPEHLRAIGFWQDNMVKEYRHLPDPKTLLDPTWAEAERKLVNNYLWRGVKFIGHPSAPCRICVQEGTGGWHLTDGHFQWPLELVHYVKYHALRLPHAFVQHVKDSQHTVFPTNDELAKQPLNFYDLDYTWWMAHGTPYGWLPPITTEKK